MQAWYPLSMAISMLIRATRVFPLAGPPVRSTSAPQGKPPPGSRASTSGRPLGSDPATGQPVLLRHGRYGHYVQLGENGGDSKPKMASLWPAMDAESLTLEEALLLLSFPREIGLHPETGKPIMAATGRYGPYISCDGDNRTLPDYESLLTTTVSDAVLLLKQPRGRGRRSGSSSVLAELGPHPSSGAPITVRTGRFGPYVSDGTVHATVPKKSDPAAVTLEAAIELLAAREDKLRSQGKDPRAAKPKKAPRRRSKRS